MPENKQRKRAGLWSGWFFGELGRARLPQIAERVSVEVKAEEPSLLPANFSMRCASPTAASGTPMPRSPACSTISRSTPSSPSRTPRRSCSGGSASPSLVYAEGGSTERLIPFDLMPRILDRSEWDLVERGCIQRVKAINVFLYDIYHDQEIIKAGLVPPEFVLLNPAYRPEMLGVEPPKSVYAHIAGIDLVRTGERDFFVLEDNVRTPSGISYVLENREIMMRLFPDAFAGQAISPVGNYPERLLGEFARGGAVWRRGPGRRAADARAATTAPISSMCSSPSRWASSWSKAAICSCARAVVWMRTTEGPVKVDVIYRRIDDDFMDPLAFRANSALGVPGILSRDPRGQGHARQRARHRRRRRQGDVLLRAAHDRVLSRRARDAEQRADLYAARSEAAAARIRKLHDLVVKEVQGSGGYGMLIGPASTAEEREAYKRRVMQQPRQLHRPADAGAVDRADADRGRDRAAACRSQALRALRQGDQRHFRRAHARGAARRLAHREFESGRRHQGHLGAGATDHAEPHRRESVLDGARHGAGGEHRAHARCQLPHGAAAVDHRQAGAAFRADPGDRAGRRAASTSCTASSRMRRSCATWRSSPPIPHRSGR